MNASFWNYPSKQKSWPIDEEMESLGEVIHPLDNIGGFDVRPGFYQMNGAYQTEEDVEPVEVVEINNELRELEYAERREIVRILSEFTDSVRPDAELIADSGDYLAEIDMLRAKGRWASENGCVKPIVSTDDRLVLKNARHPLLQQTLRAQGREVVPLDMQLDRRKHILVISGPNAGGKSVCLKTTGIVQYMFQCGFLVAIRN